MIKTYQQQLDAQRVYSSCKVAVFDLDGTVRHSKHGGGFIDSPEDIILYSGVQDILWEFKDAGYRIFGATNQGGVSYKFKTVPEVYEEINVTRKLFQCDPFDEVFVAFCHPNAPKGPFNVSSLLRKPAYGMLALIEQHCINKGQIVNWNNSFGCGDRAEDRSLFKRLDIEFRWAWDVFSAVPVPDVLPGAVAHHLRFG